MMRMIGIVWMWSNVVSSILLSVYFLARHNFSGDIHEAIYGLLFLWAMSWLTKHDDKNQWV